MYLSIIVLPLLGSIASGLLGRKLGVTGAQRVTCTCIVLTTLLAFIAFIEVGLNNIPVNIKLFTWIDSESIHVNWGFNFDALTVSMLIPVLVISSLVHIYSIGYMEHDPHNQRFFSYLSLFTFMMVVLVTADNFLLMFVGWEGVGVCSYLLVSFWFTRISANQSSIAAFLTNRVGDCFLTVGMFIILWVFGNIDYSTVFSLAPYINENIITLIGICILIGAMAKSSQVGLHVWLPMAMEGPTPVSALIHAATMVTAGVYLLMRCSPLIEYSSTALILCLWLGAVTTVFSSLIGLFQQDIKKIIAYSTMSQLGMMVIAVGLSSYNIALFHLINHAFYKGLLFLGAGSVIHAVSDNQDFRKYGGLLRFMPLTYSVMLIASLSLVAFPFMTGFYSKDLILESAYGQFFFSGIAVYFIATIGAMFTTLYSVKVLYSTFIANPNGPMTSYKFAHEGSLYMSIPLIILAIFSVFFGYITKDIFIGLGSNFLFSDNSLYILPENFILFNTEFAVPTFFKLLPLLFTITLSVLAFSISEFYPRIISKFKFTKLGYNIFGFFNQRFFIELFYNKYISNNILILGKHTTSILDRGIVELIGPYGLELSLTRLSKSISVLDTGIITSYALYILIGFLSFISFYTYPLFKGDLFIIIFFMGLFTLFLNNNSLLIFSDKLVNLQSKFNFFYFSLSLFLIDYNIAINVSARLLETFCKLYVMGNIPVEFLTSFSLHYNNNIFEDTYCFNSYLSIQEFLQEPFTKLIKVLKFSARDINIVISNLSYLYATVEPHNNITVNKPSKTVDITALFIKSSEEEDTYLEEESSKSNAVKPQSRGLDWWFGKTGESKSAPVSPTLPSSSDLNPFDENGKLYVKPKEDINFFKDKATETDNFPGVKNASAISYEESVHLYYKYLTHLDKEIQKAVDNLDKVTISLGVIADFRHKNVMESIDLEKKWKDNVERIRNLEFNLSSISNFLGKADTDDLRSTYIRAQGILGGNLEECKKEKEDMLMERARIKEMRIFLNKNYKASSAARYQAQGQINEASTRRENYIVWKEEIVKDLPKHFSSYGPNKQYNGEEAKKALADFLSSVEEKRKEEQKALGDFIVDTEDEPKGK